MKNLNITFTDKEFIRLKKEKIKSKILNWEKFILIRCSKNNGDKIKTGGHTNGNN